MSEPKPSGAPGSDPQRGDGKAASEGATTGDGSTAAEKPAPKLSPEEQMALYEEHLKETDWGHQPC